jgi:hypothetical protein
MSTATDESTTQRKETPREFAARHIGYAERGVSRTDILDEDRSELEVELAYIREAHARATSFVEYNEVRNSCKALQDMVMAARRRYWERKGEDFEEVLRANRLLAEGFQINGRRPTLKEMLRYFQQTEADSPSVQSRRKAPRSDSERRARQLARSQVGVRFNTKSH